MNELGEKKAGKKPIKAKADWQRKSMPLLNFCPNGEKRRHSIRNSGGDISENSTDMTKLELKYYNFMTVHLATWTQAIKLSQEEGNNLNSFMSLKSSDPHDFSG